MSLAAVFHKNERNAGGNSETAMHLCSTVSTREKKMLQILFRKRVSKTLNENNFQNFLNLQAKRRSIFQIYNGQTLNSSYRNHGVSS